MKYKSLNKETGLLEDIDEVRHLATDMGEFLLVLLSHPILKLVLSPGELAELLVLTALKVGQVKFTTQADQMRTVGRLSGISAAAIESVVREFNLSEEFPGSDERSAQITYDMLPQLDPQDPIVKSSPVLQSALQEQTKAKTPLDPSIERFLSRLMDKES